MALLDVCYPFAKKAGELVGQRRTANPRKLEHGFLGGLVLGSLVLCLKGMSIIMFQVSGQLVWV